MDDTGTQQRQKAQSQTVNPWLIGLAAAASIMLIIGIAMVAANADPMAFDHDPTAAATGRVMLGAGSVSTAVLLLAGAITWQLRRR